MSLLNKKSYAPLTAGTYNVTLKSFEEVTSKGYTYVAMEVITDNQRPIKFNLFEQPLNYFMSGLRNQFYPNSNEVYDFITLLELAQATTFNIYVEYNTVDGKTYRNIYTTEPKKPQPETHTTEAF